MYQKGWSSIMVKYEIKKFPLLATILTILGLVASVISITISLVNTTYDGFVSVALLEIVATVLFIAGLTTGKCTLLRVISIITTVCILIAAFVLAIAKYSMRDVVLFGIALFMLIDSVLNLVYFLASKNKKIEKLFLITSVVFTSLVAVYTIVYIVQNVSNYVDGASELAPQMYAILFSFIFISVLPAIVYRSMEKEEIEDPVEEEEEPEQEVVEENQ